MRAEEAEDGQGRFVEFDGAVDLELGAFGELGVGVGEEAGLAAAGGAVAEG